HRVSGDALSSSYTGASFANKNVGTSKSVNVSGIAITGTEAANYTANTTTTTTANITARPLVVSATSANKVYDGTTTATATLSDGRVRGDTLSSSFTPAGSAAKSGGGAKTGRARGLAVRATDGAD